LIPVSALRKWIHCLKVLILSVWVNVMKNALKKLRHPSIAGMAAVAALLCAGRLAIAENSVTVNSGEITIRNQSVSIAYHRQTGLMDVVWRNGQTLMGIKSRAELADGRVLSVDAYAQHNLDSISAHAGEDSKGEASGAHEYTIRSVDPARPAFMQHIWLYDGKPWVAVEAELSPVAGEIGTRHFDAIVLAGASSVQLSKNDAIRVLHVPFDNDMWFRYDSMAVAEMKADAKYGSDEVTAIYDNASRHGIVLGSIRHDLWKTAIDVRATGGRLTDVDIYGGISSPTGERTDTHDTVAHGLVHGAKVVSPRILIGSFDDWRDGLEAYGAANAQMHPPLVWSAGIPMGWNSWAAYADKINDHRYLDTAAFVRDALVPQGFSRNRTVYINLDAFWSNLDTVQLADAADTIKGMRATDGTKLEPGIYWTPFAYWSDDLDAYVEGTGMKYRYRDILLKAPDGSFLPKVDGGRPIDPSHPGEKARIDYSMKRFEELGFRYIKLDFLSHGALEAAHYDPAIQTGIAAYSEGMKQIVDATGNRMFISLSIAPLFPSGYGHARRLSCDTKGHIGGGDQSTEYMLNSLTYGWWTSKSLYIADPDHVVLGEKADQGARSVTEGQSRFLSAVIAGGMILDSSRVADDAQARELARAVYNNPKLFAVASEGIAFRPVEGDTGNKAAAAFMRRSAHGVYLAVFNYDDGKPQTVSIPLGRIDASWVGEQLKVLDVATGTALSPAHGMISVELQPAQSKLIELRNDR